MQSKKGSSLLEGIALLVILAMMITIMLGIGV